MRLFVLVRHGQSELNATPARERRPGRPGRPDRAGRGGGGGLALQVAGLDLDLCVHTRFGRTRATAEIALARDIPCARSSRCSTTSTSASSRPDDRRLPRLEDGAHASRPLPRRREPRRRGPALREAYERLLARPERRVLVVCHEIPVRYAINAAAGSDELDGPAHEIGNCIPHLFDEDGLARGRTDPPPRPCLTGFSRSGGGAASAACARQTPFSPLCMYARNAGASTT